jgi:hypothetical protein
MPKKKKVAVITGVVLLLIIACYFLHAWYIGSPGYTTIPIKVGTYRVDDRNYHFVLKIQQIGTLAWIHQRSATIYPKDGSFDRIVYTLTNKNTQTLTYAINLPVLGPNNKSYTVEQGVKNVILGAGQQTQDVFIINTTPKPIPMQLQLRYSYHSGNSVLLDI